VSRNSFLALAAACLAFSDSGPAYPRPASALPASDIQVQSRAASPPRSLRAETLLDRDRLRAWGIERPSRLASGEDGALYVLDARARRVVRLSLAPRREDSARGGSGEPEAAAVFGDDAPASALPHDLVVDVRGSLLVLDRSRSTLSAYDRRTAYLGTRDLDPQLADEARAPEARLLRDRYGDLWLLAPRARDLVPLDARLLRRRSDRFLTPEESLGTPTAAVFLPQGGGWIADREAGTIRRFDATGRVGRSVSVGDSLAAGPADLAVDASGAVYVADPVGSRIVIFGADGARLHTRWLGAGDHAWRPGAIAWCGDDRLAVADESRGEIWILIVERESTP
jgi:sugar lactone lactonase YvrE